MGTWYIVGYFVATWPNGCTLPRFISPLISPNL